MNSRTIPKSHPQNVVRNELDNVPMGDIALEQALVLSVINAATDKETILNLAAASETNRKAGEKRLAELGYLKVITGRGPIQTRQWLKQGRANPGAPESFRDCEKCPEMIIVPTGKFLMGSSERTGYGDYNERQIEITIPRAFAVGRFEVTFDEWEACVADGGCKSNPSPNDGGYGKGRHPVINISWNDAQEFVGWINLKAPSDVHYRLLSEAEWEYAAQGVTTIIPSQPYFFGGSEKQLCDYGNIADNTNNSSIETCTDGEITTAKVGQYRPNPFGLKDTIGNVWEWVEDCYHDSQAVVPKNVPSSGDPWLDDCDASSRRILKGGSWFTVSDFLHRASRKVERPDYLSGEIGFRLFRTL